MPASRLDRLRAQLEAASLDALIVVERANIRYLTGFAGVIDSSFSGVMAVLPDRSVLVTDFRYEQQLRACAGEGPIDIESVAGDQYQALAAGLDKAKAAHVAVEDSASVATKARLDKACGRPLDTAAQVVEGLRAIKDEDEIAAIAKSARLTDQAFGAVLPKVTEGASTRDISLAIEWHMRTHGARAAAFGLIVVAGERSSMPHATTIEQSIKPGDLVKIDIGALVGDYCSDMTRTLVVGEASEKCRRVYQAVREAQEIALAGITPGMRGDEADALARDHLAEVGFGENFGHGLGHGVGLEIHERPRLARTSKDVLEAGMVVTVEPGVYLPGFGGVRIEDLVVVEEGGVRNLTASPKELLVV